MSAKTGLDDALRLEAVYYSAPIPQNLAVLTILGAVFDKVYFPHVYLPRDGFDQVELDKEIARIQGVITPKSDDGLLGILRFVRHVQTLDGFCVFSGDRENPFVEGDVIPRKMVEAMSEAIHGPLPPGFIPTFPTNYHKGLPGSDEHVTYPGPHHYLVGALLDASKRGVPLLNDLPSLPIPGLETATAVNNAEVLSAILAIECVKLALPEMPMLQPEDLMEFRAENTATLRAFRRSMLKYTGDLNGKLKGLSQSEIEEAAQFFVRTEIAPVMDELRLTMSGPARPWYKRAIDFVRVIPESGTAFVTMDASTAIAKVLTTYAGQFFVELSAKGDQREATKRSGLYYLLRLKAYQADRIP